MSSCATGSVIRMRAHRPIGRWTRAGPSARLCVHSMDALTKAAELEILAALSLCTDLANGLPFETALRTALLALWLARRSGLPATLHDEVFRLGLLRFLGCTGFAQEEARMVGGEDIALRRAYAGVDRASKREVMAAT